MTDYLTAFLLLAGSLFMLLAGVGVLRMPDVLTRMQAASKAATLGISCMFLALAAHFQEIGVASRAVLVIGFVFLTAPVAAHMLGRSAMALGVPLWPGTRREDLEAGYGSRPGPDAAADAEETPGD
ncbi:MAG: monovalent cation/H(+) antiporter subunit G [Bryobacteraceae bacterium]|nr:monovalent cation/H(+) antiporter subunit G [Bryobacteraceae bacterium]